MAYRAPGKHYREGISLIELFQMFPDDAAAERWFEERRWGAAGQPSHCPLCGGAGKLRPVPSGRPLPYWCGGCRRNFSVRSGTVMHRSRIGLQKWAIAIYLWSTSLKGVSSMKLHRDLGITQKSAYFLAQRLREAWSGTPSGMTGRSRSTRFIWAVCARTCPGASARPSRAAGRSARRLSPARATAPPTG